MADATLNLKWYAMEVLDAALEAYGDTAVLRQKIAVRRKILYIVDLPFFIGKEDEDGIKKTVSKIKSTIM